MAQGSLQQRDICPASGTKIEGGAANYPAPARKTPGRETDVGQIGQQFPETVAHLLLSVRLKQKRHGCESHAFCLLRFQESMFDMFVQPLPGQDHSAWTQDHRQHATTSASIMVRIAEMPTGENAPVAAGPSFIDINFLHCIPRSGTLVRPLWRVVAEKGPASPSWTSI